MDETVVSRNIFHVLGRVVAEDYEYLIGYGQCRRTARQVLSSGDNSWGKLGKPSVGTKTSDAL